MLRLLLRDVEDICAVNVVRQPIRLSPDSSRVVTRLFLPQTEPTFGEVPRAARLMERVLALSDESVDRLLAEVFARYGKRHRDLEQTLLDNCEAVRRFISDSAEPSLERRLLMGAFVTGEYAIEGASVCNPSMVLAPDQSGLPPGHQRFILSLRAIGEGHISSIEFRTGTVDEGGRVRLDDVAPDAMCGRRSTPVYDRRHMRTRLRELGVDDVVLGQVFDRMGEGIKFPELEAAIAAVERASRRGRAVQETLRTIHWLASSNYRVTFPSDTSLNERVLTPASPAESGGMEDARFVRFLEEDGSVTYYATYTAYDGRHILPQLIETPDFLSFRVQTLDGSGAVDKGMALFPRRVGGDFVALSRYDGENLFLMRSDNIRSWNHTQQIAGPVFPWELGKMGNCGSPIETEAGWIVITHGVGPMREYVLGAMLLDMDDPSRVTGRLREPILIPSDEERHGYVPNVVYACGSMLHGRTLVIPYGISDHEVGVATALLDELLNELTSPA